MREAGLRLPGLFTNDTKETAVLKKQLQYVPLLALTFSQISLSAAGLNVNVVTPQSGPALLGTQIPLTAVVVGDPDPTPNYVYNLTIAAPGEAPKLRRGFGRSPTWTWTPTAFEGTFTIAVTVKNLHSGAIGTTSFPYTVLSRLVNGAAAVNPTNNPLVAFFSGPACQIPNRMRVRFTPMSVPAGGISGSMTTTPSPCRVNVTSGTPNETSMNFYVAGLYPIRTYNMRWEVLNPAGAVINAGTDLKFSTGSIPSGLDIPVFTNIGQASTAERVIVHGSLRDLSVGTDTVGNVLWYSTNADPVSTQIGGNYLAPVFNNDDPYLAGIREVDPAGNAVAETTQGAINDQLRAMGKPPIRGFHHDVRRIYTGTGTGAAPDGYIVALMGNQRVSTSAQGGTPANPVLILGDGVIVLDHNLQVAWYWDPFEHLDINTPAIFDNKCSQPGGRGCLGFNKAFTLGNDWLHSNSLTYSPHDGNLIMSARHQDSVLKINYANGTGDGRIVWKLGNGPIKGIGGATLPTFQVFTNNTKGTHDLAYPWFSHQHDAEFEFGGQLIGGARLVSVYDNGNTRQANFNTNAHSRCQLWALWEDQLVANLNRNAELPGYAGSVGSAQMLDNNSTVCHSGNVANTTTQRSQTTESDGNANEIHTLGSTVTSYRSWRMRDMYTPPNP